MSFTGGAHKSITGAFTFFSNNVEQNVGALEQHMNLTGQSSVYVIMSGRFTPNQRTIIRKRCKLEVENFLRVYNWLRENNPHYMDMPDISQCPTPIIFEDEADTNNTDESGNPDIEKHVEFQYFFPSHEEPNRSTATFSSEEEFLNAFMQGKEPTLVFSSTAYQNDWQLTLSRLFPLYFPFGVGDMKDDSRANRVSEVEAMKHYLRLSLPQFQKPDFILVLGHILFRKLAFQSASVRCMSKAGNDGITLGEAFSNVTDDQIMNMAKASQVRDLFSEGGDMVPATLLHTVKTSCKNVPYADEATLEARTKLFGLWTHFGPPSIFFTISPADECSFRVGLYCNTSKQYLPNPNISENDCIASMLFRAKERTENPGACAREFNALRDIVMEILIGWDSKKGEQTRKGIFGEVLAWGDTTEEQGRLTLHAHILLFIKNFDRLRSLLWSDKEEIREKAKSELIKYFEKVMCSTYDISEEELAHEREQKDMSVSLHTPAADLEVKEVCRIAPVIMEKQVLRNMRQKEVLEPYEGYVAYCPGCFKRFTTTSMVTNALKRWYEMAKLEEPELFPDCNLDFPLSKARQDSFAIRYSYDMERLSGRGGAAKKFLTSVAHLRFNEHDWRHRPACFKKGPECRFDFPRWIQEKFNLEFGEEESSGKWYKAYGNGMDVQAKGFSLVTTRSVPDVFLNTHNKTVSSLLGYNNNVASGGRDMIYYVTLYNTKTNQKEEKFPFHKQCVAIARRISRSRMVESQVEESLQAIDNTTRTASEPSYGKGLGHVLSGICAHLSSSVISATMAWQLIMHASRFRFSHDFVPILLSQMIDWLDNKPIGFQWRRNSITGEGWLHSRLMDYLFRPTGDGFEKISYYSFSMEFELVLKSTLKKRREQARDEENEEYQEEEGEMDPYDLVDWDFLDDHPGQKYACLKKMKKIKIPMIYYQKELPDIQDCRLWESDDSDIPPSVLNARNEYATVMLLLFLPFQDVHVFGEFENRWKLFCEIYHSNGLDPDAGYYMQNIQDVHNSKKMVKPKDRLVLETELQRFTKNPDDMENNDFDNDSSDPVNQEEADGDDEMDTVIEELARVRNQLENHEQNCIITNTMMPFNQKHIAPVVSFTDKTVIVPVSTEPQQNNAVDNNNITQPASYAGRNFIEIIMDFDRPLTAEDHGKKWTLNDADALKEDNPKVVVDRLDACAKMMNLDIYQKAAFNVICSSFMLKYLEKGNNSSHPNYSEAREKLIKRGAEKQLVMFLSGAGGCGKSHVIGAAKSMCQHFCRCINKGFDSSAFLVTATTNSAAALLGGETIHSVAQLRSKFSNVSVNGIDVKITWITANMIIIDEISMLSLPDFMKLDKNLRKLMREVGGNEALPFGGLHIILCGDFFQLNPVMSIPIYNRRDNALWNLITQVIFLKGANHRFENDPEWGELLDRMRLGLLTDNDYDFLDSRVIGPKLQLPGTAELNGECISYACPTNALRNRITENNFANMLKKLHPLGNDPRSAPMHTILIKGIFKKRKGGDIKSEQFHRLVYNSCGDDNIVASGNNGRVDPCLKLTVGCSIRVSEYKDPKQKVVKGVTGKFYGLALKAGHQLREEIWSGYKVNVIDADEVDYIVCERVRNDERDPVRYFTLPAKKFSVTVKIPMNGGRQHIPLDSLEIIQFPINLDDATTGHKLQGMTKSVLDIADFNYGENWIYVACSRVRTSNGLFLFKRLNRSKYIGPSQALLTEIELLEKIEQRTLRNLQTMGTFPSDIDVTEGVTTTIARARESMRQREPESDITEGGVVPTRRKIRLSGFDTIHKKKIVTETQVTKSLGSDIFLWLTQHGMSVIKTYNFVPGNCLFDSIAFLIPAWNGNGKRLRASAIEWTENQLVLGKSDWVITISNNYRHYEYYGKRSYQEYLEHLKDVSVYATTVDLYMLTFFLEVGIVLYSSSYQRIVDNETRFVPNMQFASSFQTRINLFYDPIMEHYEPIIVNINN
jgi:hypothetical protein